MFVFFHEGILMLPSNEPGIRLTIRNDGDKVIIKILKSKEELVSPLQ